MPGGTSKYEKILEELDSYKESTDLVNDIGKIKAKSSKPFALNGDIRGAIENFNYAKRDLTEVLSGDKIDSLKYLKFDPNEKGEVKINSEDRNITRLIDALETQKSLFVTKQEEFLDKKENELPKKILDKLWRLVEKEYNETLKLKGKVLGKVIYLRKLSIDEVEKIWKIKLRGPQKAGLLNNFVPVDMVKMDSSKEHVSVTYSGHQLPLFNICFACDKNVLVFIDKESHHIYKYNKTECTDTYSNHKYSEFKLSVLSKPVSGVSFNKNGNLQIYS